VQTALRQKGVRQLVVTGAAKLVAVGPGTDLNVRVVAVVRNFERRTSRFLDDGFGTKALVAPETKGIASGNRRLTMSASIRRHRSNA
jgi:hypothetical protein